MKTKIVLYSIIGLLGLSLLFAFKKDDKRQYVSVQVYITGVEGRVSIYKQGTLSSHEFKTNIKEFQTGETYKKYWDIINSSVLNEGYSLKSSSTAAASAFIIEYIFEKD